jgi:putative (di)nucleoside polyphosphate hydrolase
MLEVAVYGWSIAINMARSTRTTYRKGVGMVVFNQTGEVLVGERSGVANGWQFPQGGIDDGEDPQSTAIRELYEEVGIADAKLVYKTEDWLKYDFPDDLELIGKWRKYKGQKQKWFLFYWSQPVSECNLELHQREFDRVKYMPLEDTASYIVAFKKGMYEHLIARFRPLIDQYLAESSTC